MAPACSTLLWHRHVLLLTGSDTGTGSVDIRQSISGWFHPAGIRQRSAASRNEDGIHQYGLGVYVAPLKKAFTPFSLLACDLSESDWFVNTIESWYWFDSNECRNYDDPDYDCLLVKGIKR